jgi:hypothetical protein
LTQAKIVLDKWFPDGALRRALKLSWQCLAAVGVIAFAVGFIHAWSWGAGLLLILVGIPLAAVVTLVGAGALLVTAVRRYGAFATWPQKSVAMLLGPLVALAAALAFFPVLWAGNWLGDLSRLALNHADYAAIVGDAERTRKPAWFAESRGITYNVDAGPPVRVAFNPVGMLDNWSGIVFDPSGEVMIADGFVERGRFGAPERITKIFGGDLVRCRHLWGDYYTCSFT